MAPWPWPWLALWPAALAAGIQALPSQALQYLPLLRDAVLDGQCWRLITGHWVHTNAAHLALNLGGWGLLCAAHAPAWQSLSARQQAWAWLTLSLGTSTLLLTTFPDVSPYLGLSGLLHGWWLLLAWRTARTATTESDARWGWGSLLTLAGKLASDAWAPHTGTSEWIGARVAFEGHVCGAAVAAALVAGTAGIRRVLR
jgi:rhomboid family GlyGly-CTERM serine protease